jgi:uncharacterized membrane protein YebE (DUF533 family)
MSDAARLGLEAFRALAAVAWADGKIDPAEAEAITRAATEDGLAGADLEAVRHATETRVALKEVDVSKLSEDDRLHVYAISSWIAAINAGVGLRERIALNDLGKALTLSQKQREAMDHAVADLMKAPEGDKPAKFDLPGLRKSLAERVAAVKENVKPPAKA